MKYRKVMNSGHPSGFTLIELLVVISIIAILAALLLPTINLVRESSYQSVCLSNSRQIAMGMLTYVGENENMAMSPWNSDSGINASWNHRTSAYFSDGSLKYWVCPNNRSFRQAQELQSIPIDGGYVVKESRADYSIHAANGDWWSWGHSASRAPAWIDGTWVNTAAVWASAGSRSMAQIEPNTAMMMETQDRPTWPYMCGFGIGEQTMVWGTGRLQNAHRGKNAIAHFDGHVSMMSAQETRGSDPWNLRGIWTYTPGD